MLTRVLCWCGGFLFAVLWFDLMFDVQVVRHADNPLPEPVLASIGGYYRRVTTDAFPMNRAVAAAMLAAVAGSVWQLRRARRRAVAAAAVALIVAPVVLAAMRVVPNAVQLGGRTDTAMRQSELARMICSDHVWCIAAVGLFAVVQLSGALNHEPGDR